jgi:hypothetical protein
VIVRREVWRGHPWAAMPNLVVADEPQLLAVYTPERAPFGFAEPPVVGRHPYAGRAHWTGHGVLALHRPGDAHGVLVFWQGEGRSFAGWYINLQAPLRRTRIGIDTLDHTVDLWSTDGIEWTVKDADELAACVAGGRYTAAEAADIRAEAARIERELRENGKWWSDKWATWVPPTGWSAPELDPAWRTEPTVAG